ncbi:MAG: efflux RND transporter periplasmic adaptor subunit [Endozoicomonas sp.]
MARYHLGSTVISKLCLSILLLSSIVHGEEKTPPAVAVTRVQYTDHARVIHTSGILAYKSRQVMSFKTAGPIDRLLVEEGDRIDKRQLLASLTLDEIRAQVEEAKARVVMARNNLDRVSKLHSNNMMSLDQFQSAETELAVWESKLKIARFNLEYSHIRAPAAGQVLRRHVEENELVSPYQPVLTLADSSQGWVIRTGITDAEIVRVAEGDRATVIFDAWPGESFTGTLTKLAVLADERTGTFEVEITLPAAFDKLRAGFIGKVTITPSSTSKVALIPVEAIIQSDTATAEVFVYFPDSASVKKRHIQLNFLLPGMIASRTGLEENDLVVTTGAGFLKDGDTVRVLRGPEAAEALETEG